MDDAPSLYKKSKRLEDDIKHLTDMAITSVTESFDEELSSSFDELPIAANVGNAPDFLA